MAMMTSKTMRGLEIFMLLVAMGGAGFLVYLLVVYIQKNRKDDDDTKPAATKALGLTPSARADLVQQYTAAIQKLRSQYKSNPAGVDPAIIQTAVTARQSLLNAGCSYLPDTRCRSLYQLIFYVQNLPAAQNAQLTPPPAILNLLETLQNEMVNYAQPNCSQCAIPVQMLHEQLMIGNLTQDNIDQRIAYAIYNGCIDPAVLNASQNDVLFSADGMGPKETMQQASCDEKLTAVYNAIQAYAIVKAQLTSVQANFKKTEWSSTPQLTISQQQGISNKVDDASVLLMREVSDSVVNGCISAGVANWIYKYNNNPGMYKIQIMI